MTRKEKSFSHDEEKGPQGEAEQAEVEQPEQIDSARNALAEEKEKAEKYLANWQRVQADFINFKRRSEQERAESVGYANSTLILNMLPVLDDLDRAMGNIPDELAGSSWVDGIRHIYRKLQAVLESQGVSTIEAKGKEFDPNLHEAVMCVEGEEGKVMEEMQKGYKLRSRVIRPAKVTVGKESRCNNEEQ